MMRGKVCEDSCCVVKQVLTSLGRVQHIVYQTLLSPPSFCAPCPVYHLGLYNKYILKCLVKLGMHIRKSVWVSVVSGTADTGSNEEIMPI